MPFEPVAGTDLAYTLIAYDENGEERKEIIEGSERFLSKTVLEQLRDHPVTDIFIMSHGWKGDVPAARDQYQRWIGAMASNAADRERMRAGRAGFSPLFIGLHWPSQPWGDEELGGATALSFGLTGNTASAGGGIDTLIDLYASRIADTPRARAALKTVFDAAMRDIAPQHLPADVRQAYEVLNDEAQIGSDGAAGAPGADREKFDPERAYRNSRHDVMSYGGAGSSGILDPLRQLSFWKMKDRARRFGESGANALLARIQEMAPRARIHLMGHSFGCIVVSAMLTGSKEPVRPVSSLVLVQGALSLWSYCRDIPVASGRSGYFHAIVDKGYVSGPIVATQSRHDKALSAFYPLGAGIARQIVYEAGALPRYAAVGIHGIAGMETQPVFMNMLAANADYIFQPGRIYNLESSAYIREGQGLSGAHKDIAKPEIAHVIWEAAR